MTDCTPEEQAVLDDLTAALAARRDVEPRHREAAQAAFTWRTVDDELMELTYDSLDEPSTVRGVGVGPAPGAVLHVPPRQPRGGGRRRPRLRARASPAARRHRGHDQRRRRARRGHQRTRTAMFELMGTLPGPVRFTVEGDGRTTPWVTL